MQELMFPEKPTEERVHILHNSCDAVEDGVYVKVLTEEEVRQAKDDLSEKFIEFNKLKTELKAIVAEYKAKMTPIVNQMAETSNIIKTRTQEVNGILYMFKYEEERMVGYYDETGRLISSRRMKPDEQKTMFTIQKAI